MGEAHGEVVDDKRDDVRKHIYMYPTRIPCTLLSSVCLCRLHFHALSCTLSLVLLFSCSPILSVSPVLFPFLFDVLFQRKKTLVNLRPLHAALPVVALGVDTPLAPRKVDEGELPLEAPPPPRALVETDLADGVGAGRLLVHRRLVGGTDRVSE